MVPDVIVAGWLVWFEVVFAGWHPVAAHVSVAFRPGPWHTAQPPDPAWTAATSRPPAWHPVTVQEGVAATVCDVSIVACIAFGPLAWHAPWTQPPFHRVNVPRGEGWHFAQLAVPPWAACSSVAAWHSEHRWLP